MIHETLAVARETAKHDLEMIMRHWTDGSKHVITDYSSPSNLLSVAKCVGTNSELKQWVKDFPWKYGAIYVVSKGDVVYDMDKIKPGLEYFRIVIEDEVE